MNCGVNFYQKGITITSPNNQNEIIMSGPKWNGLYMLDITPIIPHHAYAAQIPQNRTWHDWHKVMGHIYMGSIKMLKEKDMVKGIKVNSDIQSPQCISCIKAKSHIAPFPQQSKTEYKEIGDITFTDVWGPARTTGIRGERYYVSFTDGATRRTQIYFMKKKDVLRHIKDYQAFIKIQTSKNLKAMQFDGGGEYIDHEVINYLKSCEIRYEITAAYSPAQNGIAKRLNRTLIEHTCAMMLEHNIPYFLWPEAVAYACYLKNKSPTQALKELITPEEAFTGKKPDISMLQEFGVKCWVLQQDGQNSKLDPKSQKFIFVDLSDHGKAWRYWNPHSRQIQTSQNVIFENQTHEYHYTIPNPASSNNVTDTLNSPLLEGEQEISKQISGSQLDSKFDLEPPKTPKKTTTNYSVQPSNTPSKSHIPKPAPLPCECSARIASQPSIDYRVLNNPQARNKSPGWETVIPLSPDQKPTNEFALLSSNPITSDEPSSYYEAISRYDAAQWQDAMDKEITQLENTGTWELTELPADRKPIKYKWVLKVKRDHTGAITHYKGRLVAKGFSQIPGIDFIETFAPVVRLETFRTLIAIAACYKLDIHTMDVVGAYLNGELNETIYIEQPPGYEDRTNHVYRLRRPLYGLKQSGAI